ncbi:hypothetical protein FA13DRAFT_1812188, partial [Coprinellus micaceus]
GRGRVFDWALSFVFPTIWVLSFTSSASTLRRSRLGPLVVPLSSLQVFVSSLHPPRPSNQRPTQRCLSPDAPRSPPSTASTCPSWPPPALPLPPSHSRRPHSSLPTAEAPPSSPQRAQRTGRRPGRLHPRRPSRLSRLSRLPRPCLQDLRLRPRTPPLWNPPHPPSPSLDLLITNHPRRTRTLPPPRPSAPPQSRHEPQQQRNSASPRAPSPTSTPSSLSPRPPFSLSTISFPLHSHVLHKRIPRNPRQASPAHRPRRTGVQAPLRAQSPGPERAGARASVSDRLDRRWGREEEGERCGIRVQERVWGGV